MTKIRRIYSELVNVTDPFLEGEINEFRKYDRRKSLWFGCGGDEIVTETIDSTVDQIRIVSL